MSSRRRTCGRLRRATRHELVILERVECLAPRTVPGVSGDRPWIGSLSRRVSLIADGCTARKIGRNAFFPLGPRCSPELLNYRCSLIGGTEERQRTKEPNENEWRQSAEDERPVESSDSTLIPSNDSRSTFNERTERALRGPETTTSRKRERKKERKKEQK